MYHTVIVVVGGFGLDLLGGSLTRNPESLSRSLVQVIHYYLAGLRSRGPGWPYPDFRRNGQVKSTVEVPIKIEDRVWEAFSNEAERQQVSTDELIQHAILYFVAERDQGRLAQRIVENPNF